MPRPRLRLAATVLLAAVAWVALGVRASLVPLERSPQTAIVVVARPLALADPAPGDVLRMTGAWELASTNPQFDSLSGLDILPDGRFVAVTDRGQLVRFPLPGRRGAAEIEDLVYYAKQGGAVVDAEAVIADDGGAIVYALENQNAIVAHEGPGRSRLNVKPPDMRAWSAVSGPETLLRLPDGRLLTVAEGREAGSDGTFPAIVYPPDIAKAQHGGLLFHIALADGFRPVDGKAMADGTVILLARCFTFPFDFTSAIFVFDAREIASAALVRPRLVGQVAQGALSDNYEGLALSESGDRATLWLVSDRNGAQWIQRTLLLRLEARKSALRSLAGAPSEP